METALTLGRRGIVRGPAGIGKSDALALIEEEFSRAEDDVLVVTASAANGGAVTRLFGTAVPTLGIIGSGAVDPMQRMERFGLQSVPFRGYPWQLRNAAAIFEMIRSGVSGGGLTQDIRLVARSEVSARAFREMAENEGVALEHLHRALRLAAGQMPPTAEDAA